MFAAKLPSQLVYRMMDRLVAQETVTFLPPIAMPCFCVRTPRTVKFSPTNITLCDTFKVTDVPITCSTLLVAKTGLVANWSVKAKVNTPPMMRGTRITKVQLRSKPSPHLTLPLHVYDSKTAQKHQPSPQDASSESIRRYVARDLDFSIRRSPLQG